MERRLRVCVRERIYTSRNSLFYNHLNPLEIYRLDIRAINKYRRRYLKVYYEQRNICYILVFIRK